MLNCFSFTYILVGMYEWCLFVSSSSSSFQCASSSSKGIEESFKYVSICVANKNTIDQNETKRSKTMQQHEKQTEIKHCTLKYQNVHSGNKYFGCNITTNNRLQFGLIFSCFSLLKGSHRVIPVFLLFVWFFFFFCLFRSAFYLSLVFIFPHKVYACRSIA